MVFTNISEIRLAIGKTKNTVGKAIIQESIHELNHGENTSLVKPKALMVLISETIPLMTRDKKKGTRKIIARAGNFGIPKI